MTQPSVLYLNNKSNLDFDITKIEIGVLSFNLEDLNEHKKHINDFENKLMTDFKHSIGIEQNSNKIWFISTQEDVHNSIFCNTLKEYFKLIYNDKYLLIHEQEGIIIKSFNIHVMIFIPEKIAKYVIGKPIIHKITHLKDEYGKYIVKAKNTVICILTLKTKIGNDEVLQNLFFINSHLPIKTPKIKHKKTFRLFKFKKQNKTKKISLNNFKSSSSSSSNSNSNNTNSLLPNNNNSNSNSLSSNNNKIDYSLGYSLRITALNQVLDYVDKYIKTHGNTINNHIIWTGDLNFRIDTENNKTSNQITKYINDQINKDVKIKLQDLSQIDTYGPTCKTVTDINKKKSDECKEQYSSNSIDNKTSDCYTFETKSGRRNPSYCDRILGWSDGNFEIKSEFVQPLVNTFFATLSDHNPILGTLYFYDKTRNSNV